MALADGTPTVERVGIVGAGLIGAGWLMHYLRVGLEVVVHDPAPGADDRLRRAVDELWPTLERIGLRDGASPDRLRFGATLEDVVAEVQVVQESTPEDVERKVDLYARMDAAAPPDVVLLSSTSGLPATAMQARCRHPERVAVGHPFHPVYILPLVEVVKGEQTTAETMDWATAFYAHYEKKPIALQVEVPGFVATRIQEALWREMLHIVAEGEATVEQVDDAVRYGPGPRWALMGPSMAFHLGGGEGGMAYTLEQFGPFFHEPWSRLDSPPLTDELRTALIDGCDRMSAGRTVAEMARERDACLIELMRAVDRCRADQT
jgi:carnitine 3-dehydrogenase